MSAYNLEKEIDILYEEVEHAVESGNFYLTEDIKDGIAAALYKAYRAGKAANE